MPLRAHYERTATDLHGLAGGEAGAGESSLFLDPGLDFGQRGAATGFEA